MKNTDWSEELPQGAFVSKKLANNQFWNRNGAVLSCVNPMTCNLLFDDGTCMDQRLPRGLTDWINSLYTNAESLDYG